VAVKVLPAHLAQDPEALSRFEREAKAVAALSHPNILAIHDFGTEQGVRYAVMELLEGETLRGRLTRSALAWREVAEVGAAVAEGLAAAHSRGIIHRDLKPENIFLTTGGQVKILDFGIARVRPKAVAEAVSSATTRSPTTAPGTVIGTVGYMSPEQVLGEKAEAPSDIFACGCVLYEMVTGRRAFARPTAAETMVAILHDNPPALATTGKDTPLELEQVIGHCLEKQPGKRFQSARDLAFDLRAVLSGGEIARSGARRQSWPGLVVATALVLLVTLGAALWWWQPWRRPSAGLTQQHLVSTFPGSHREASFSPDGSMIAFINEVGGVPQVWVKNLAQGDPIQITSGDLPASRPRWSPNNDQIVFGRGKGWLSIWSVPPLGGVPRKIIDHARNPSWSWDGTRLVFEKHEKTNQQIWTARADGSDQREVKGVPTPEISLCDRMPAFSPDGSLIAFCHCQRGTPLIDLWVIPSTGGQARQLTFDDHFGGTPVWTPDGRYLIFSSQRRGSMTLWRVAVSGGEPEPVTQGAGEDTDPEISRDGRKLVYTNTRNSSALTLMDPATQQHRELREARSRIGFPSFSPAGDKIAFHAGTDEGEFHIFTTDTDGGNLTQVTRGKGERNVIPQWSADGSALYFYEMRPMPSFRKISINGGQSSEIVRGWLWGAQTVAQVDPTERFIAYSQREKGIHVATVVREIATGKETVFRPSLDDARWSKDGRWLLGTDIPSDSRAFGDIVVCSVATGACRKLATRGAWPIWSSDGARIIFQRWKSADASEVWSISFEGGDEKLVGELRPLGPLRTAYHVSPKGEIVYVRFNQGRHELWLADLPRP
jgi:eukaryotic-like serine/threonine-protein kinase